MLHPDAPPAGATTKMAPRAPCLAAYSAGGNHIRVKMNANLAAEHIQENGDPVAVRHSLEVRGKIDECACEHSHLVASAEGGPCLHSDKALVILASFQRGHHALRHRSRVLAVADETR